MRLLILFGFILLCNYSFAQPRVITFESEQQAADTNLEKNVVKLNLFELVSGDLPIYYERALSDMFSIEASVGVTFGDYIGSVFSGFNSSPFDEAISSKYGYSLSAAVRFYPIAVLEEFYVAPEFKFRKYNWDREIMEYDEPNSSFNPDIKEVSESRSYVMPRITVGYAFFYDNNLIFDWHAGIGMNTPTESAYRYNTETDSQEFSTKKLNTRPRVHIGFKIGYVF